jgi:hypothetical protein
VWGTQNTLNSFRCCMFSNLVCSVSGLKNGVFWVVTPCGYLFLVCLSVLSFLLWSCWDKLVLPAELRLWNRLSNWSELGYSWNVGHVLMKAGPVGFLKMLTNKFTVSSLGTFWRSVWSSSKLESNLEHVRPLSLGFWFGSYTLLRSGHLPERCYD